MVFSILLDLLDASWGRRQDVRHYVHLTDNIPSAGNDTLVAYLMVYLQICSKENQPGYRLSNFSHVPQQSLLRIAVQSRATFHQNVLNVNLPCSYLAGKSQLTQRDWDFQLSCLSFEKRELLCQNDQTAMCFH